MLQAESVNNIKPIKANAGAESIVIIISVLIISGTITFVSLLNIVSHISIMGGGTNPNTLVVLGFFNSLIVVPVLYVVYKKFKFSTFVKWILVILALIDLIPALIGLVLLFFSLID